MAVSRTVHLDDLSPSEMAELFGEYDARQQAAFFNTLGAIARYWGATGWCGQAHEIVHELDDDGKLVVEKLADHFAHVFAWSPTASPQPRSDSAPNPAPNLNEGGES